MKKTCWSSSWASESGRNWNLSDCECGCWLQTGCRSQSTADLLGFSWHHNHLWGSQVKGKYPLSGKEEALSMSGVRSQDRQTGWSVFGNRNSHYPRSQPRSAKQHLWRHNTSNLEASCVFLSSLDFLLYKAPWHAGRRWVWNHSILLRSHLVH